MGLREKIKSQRERRKRSIRIKIEGTAERPRLTVYKSLKYISAQIVDDSKGITLASASSQEKDIKSGKCGYSKRNRQNFSFKGER